MGCPALRVQPCDPHVQPLFTATLPCNPPATPAGGTLQAAQNVHIPNLPLAATAGDTIIQIEVDVPATDNIRGWSYQLDYVPGTTGTATAVHDGTANPPTATSFYVSRLAAAVMGARLSIPLKRLGDLRCDPGTGTYGACTGGGKFMLKSLTAYSWFDSDGIPVSEASYTSAESVADFTVKSVQFGSPLATTAAPWDKFFYVGEQQGFISGGTTVRRKISD